MCQMSPFSGIDFLMYFGRIRLKQDIPVLQTKLVQLLRYGHGQTSG